MSIPEEPTFETFPLVAYGQYDEVGLEPQEEGTSGAYALPTPVDLVIGAVLDLNVTLVGTTVKGRNLTLTAVCREYGI